MENETVKKYTKGSLTIEWRPDKCIHSRICWHKAKGLPDVFNPALRPWIQPENASEEAIMRQIDHCPSGALSYEKDNLDRVETSSISINVTENGPLLIDGPVEICLNSGEKQLHSKKVALCRCGASANKPFCDGAHIASKFQG